MKKLLTLTLALVALIVLSSFGVAQERRDVRESRIDPSQQVPSHKVSLPCCDCLGKVTTLDLSTGQSSPIDPIWKVTNGPAYTTPPVGSWILLPPAQWIQPVSSPLPSGNVPAGVYKYTVKFYVPKCTIPGEVRLTGNFAADNSAQAFLDTVPIPNASCSGPVCFNTPQAPVSLNAAPPIVPGPGLHILEIQVNNISGYSGLIVNAKLTRKCASGNPGAQGEVGVEQN
jgi:hypothetical protein